MRSVRSKSFFSILTEKADKSKSIVYVELVLFSCAFFGVTVRLVCEPAAGHGLCNENIGNNRY